MHIVQNEASKGESYLLTEIKMHARFAIADNTIALINKWDTHQPIVSRLSSAICFELVLDARPRRITVIRVSPLPT